MNKPKTTEQHKLTGTYRKDRHENRVKLKEVDGVPPSPFEDEYRTSRWVHYCELMKETHHLTQRHLDAIEVMCKLDADWLVADADVRKNGITFVSKGGQIKANPAVGIKLNIQSQIIRMYEQFGMTPRSSMNMKVPADQGKKAPDPLEEVLKLMAQSETAKPQTKRAKA